MSDSATPWSVHGILQARILEWVAIPSLGDLPNPGIEPRSLVCLADSLLSESPQKSIRKWNCWVQCLLHLLQILTNQWNKSTFTLKVLVVGSCPTLCDLMDYSPPGSTVHEISQARILEWVAVPIFRGIFLTQGSNLGLLHCR